MVAHETTCDESAGISLAHIRRFGRQKCQDRPTLPKRHGNAFAGRIRRVAGPRNRQDHSSAAPSAQGGSSPRSGPYRSGSRFAE